MQKTITRLTILLLVPILLIGCADPKTLERMGLITTMGYDLTEDGKILTTMVLLQIDPEAPQNFAVLTTKADTTKGARIKADLKSPKKLQSGQLRVALFSEEVVKKGLVTLADTLARDPAISDLTYLAVVEGNVNKMLNMENKKFSDISQLIYKELDQNIKGETIPSATLQEVMHDYYSDGIDPSMPILKVSNGEIQITGMAMIKRDKMVGKIGIEDSFYLKLINDRYTAGSIEMSISNEGIKYLQQPEGTDKLVVVLDTIRSSSHINLINKEKLEFDLKIKLNTRLMEINQAVDLKNPANLKQIDKKLSKKMEEDLGKFISKTRELGTDPFGFGEIYRKSVRDSNMTAEKWHEMYPESKVNVKVDLEIVRTGVVE